MCMLKQRRTNASKRICLPAGRYNKKGVYQRKMRTAHAQFGECIHQEKEHFCCFLVEMEWCNLNSLKLIELYRQHEQCLWNPVRNDYKNKIIKKNYAWDQISGITKCDSNETKKEMESLLGLFRRECQ